MRERSGPVANLYMSTEDQNQDFEKLQRLLKLKRHEQPPPRFFNDFSSKVTARISAGEQGKDSLEVVGAPVSWLQRLWQAIESKPALSGVFTAGVCGLVVAGAFMADKAPNELPKFTNNEPAKVVERSSLFAKTPALAPMLASSTNPAAVLPGSLFNTTPMLQTFPASGMPIPAGLK